MNTETRALEQLIVERRRDLDRNMEALRDEARALVDWREHYRKHTGAAIGVAVAAGVLAGFMTASRRPASRRMDFDARRRAQGLLRAIDPHERTAHAAAEIRDGLVSALVGLVSAKVVDALGRVVPDIHAHLSERGAQR